MYIATLGPYWVKRFGGVLPCEPVVYSTYPFVQNYPDRITDFDINDQSYFYDLAVVGGTTFNLNLAGYEDSWTAIDGTVWTSFMGDKVNILVDGPVINASGEIDQWRYIRSFLITEPASLAAYQAVGGNDAGSVNAPFGWTPYPGVASFDAWYRSLVKARNYGYPIICETWYSLNTSRVDKTKGYDNYSWAGDGGANSLPYIDVETNSGYIKQYYAGLFKVTADMYAPLDEDIVAGATYIGDQYGGELRLIVNGVVVDSVVCATPARYIYGGFEGGIYEGTPLSFGTGKNTIRFLDISAGTVAFDNLRWEPAYGDPSTFIDTYQVKMAWMVEAETGLSRGVYDPDSVVEWYPPSFYALPNPPLQCDPNEPLPGTVFTPASPYIQQLLFLETFSEPGSEGGGLSTKSPDISPPGIRWRETYAGDPAIVPSPGGFYNVIGFADYQEIWIQEVGSTISNASWSGGFAAFTTTDAHELADGTIVTVAGVTPAGYNGTFIVSVINSVTFEVEMPVDPGTYTSDGTVQRHDRMEGVRCIEMAWIEDPMRPGYSLLDFELRNATTGNSIEISVQGDMRWQLQNHIYVDYQIGGVWQTQGAWNLNDGNVYNWFGRNVLRIEIRDNQQLVYLNGVLRIETNYATPFSTFSCENIFIFPTAVSLDYVWMSQRSRDSLFVTDSVPPTGILLSKFQIDSNYSGGMDIPLQGLAPLVGFSGRTWDTDATYPAVVNNSLGYAASPTAAATQRFYAAYGDATLTTPVPGLTVSPVDQRKTYVRFGFNTPNTDIAGDVFTCNVNFAKVAGTAISVTVNLKIVNNGEDPTQLQLIVKEGVTVLESVTDTVTGITANSGPYVFIIEIDDWRQRVLIHEWNGIQLVSETLADLFTNPYWGHFCQIEFISDNPQFKLDGTTPANEASLDVVIVETLQNVDLSVPATPIVYPDPPDPPPPALPLSSGSQVFDVINTNGGTVNTVDIVIALTAGQTIKVGTDIVPGASTSAPPLEDTNLRLLDPSSAQVAANDDISGSNYRSYFEYVAATTGDHTLILGAYLDQQAVGTVAWEIYA